MAKSIESLYSQEHLRNVVKRSIGAGAIMLDGQSKHIDPMNTLFSTENPLDFEGRVTVKGYVMDEIRQNLLFALLISRDGKQPEEPNKIFDRALLVLAENELPPKALESPYALKEYILTKYPNLKGSL